MIEVLAQDAALPVPELDAESTLVHISRLGGSVGDERREFVEAATFSRKGDDAEEGESLLRRSGEPVLGKGTAGLSSRAASASSLDEDTELEHLSESSQEPDSNRDRDTTVSMPRTNLARPPRRRQRLYHVDEESETVPRLESSIFNDHTPIVELEDTTATSADSDEMDPRLVRAALGVELEDSDSLDTKPLRPVPAAGIEPVTPSTQAQNQVPSVHSEPIAAVTTGSGSGPHHHTHGREVSEGDMTTQFDRGLKAHARAPGISRQEQTAYLSQNKFQQTARNGGVSKK